MILLRTSVGLVRKLSLFCFSPTVSDIGSVEGFNQIGGGCRIARRCGLETSADTVVGARAPGARVLQPLG